MHALYLNALRQENREARPPVWLMRQAGRYQPAYRALRERYHLLEMFRDPELIQQVTELPVGQFRPDAAILFSDILIIFDALGIEWDVQPGIGPVVAKPIRSTQDALSLNIRPASDALGFVYKGIERLKQTLQVPLIGFCGGPFTVCSYAIEGGGAKALRHTKEWLYSDPEGFHSFLETATTSLIDHMQSQRAAGVDAFQLFDSWAGMLPIDQFALYAKRHLKPICAAARRLNLPLTLFARAPASYMMQLADLKADALSCDWSVDLQELRKRVGPQITLQGNLDPSILFAGRSAVQREARRLLDLMRGDRGYVFSLGHGILPETDPECVRQLIDEVKAYG